MPISIKKFPRAIIHIDGDSFFASCEMVRRPDLRGKAVVTGYERGIATAMSAEAKRLGVTRGMPVYKIKREFPSVIILSSDYESYALYSKRMNDIVRRYTNDVEEYSVDECFADITGLRRSLRMSYPDIAKAIKHDLQEELGLTFSVGLSVNKVLAKVASRWQKPDGFTSIPGYKIEEHIRELAVKDIWGIGPNTSIYFEKLGVRTALQLVKKSPEFIKTYLTKPTIEIWRELRGEFVLHLNTEKKSEYKSIMKTQTFTPASEDRDLIFAELSSNIELACSRLRHHKLYTKEIIFYLKGQDFRHYSIEIELPASVCVPEKIIEVVKNNFSKVYKERKFYRATGIIFKKITTWESTTADLFGEFEKGEKINRIYDEIDALALKFGRSVVGLGSSVKKEKRSHVYKKFSMRLLPLPLLGKVS